MDKELLISEFQELRATMTDYHSHKEQTAYAVFALAVGVTSWVLASQDLQNTLLSIVVFCSVIALHLALRWQLIQRRHAAQLYGLYSASIRRLLVMSREEAEKISLVDTPTEPLASIGSRYYTLYYLLPARTETWRGLLNHYPVFDIVHNEIQKIVERNGRIFMIEYLTSASSLVCVLLVGHKLFLT